MYDYLGTFTQEQLTERHAYLRRLVHALPSKISHLNAKADRLAGRVVVKLSAPEQTFVNSVGSKSYQLGGTTQETVIPSMSLAVLQESAFSSKYPTRLDPLTGNVSLGSSAYRNTPTVTSVSGSPESFYHLTDDDAVVAAQVDKILRPMLPLLKRQSLDEDRSKRLLYRASVLRDEAAKLTRLLETYEAELEVIVDLVNEVVDVIAPDGTSRQESVHPSAGADKELGPLTPQSDREDLFGLLFPPTVRETVTSTPADIDMPYPVVPEIPAEVVSLNIPSGAPAGDIEAFLEAFPAVPRSLKRARLQVMANVYKYAYLTGFMKSFEDSGTLVRNPTGGKGTRDESGLRFLPPNVLSDLQAFASSANALWGVRFRITEAWPATGWHMSPGHFTGNCVDMALDIPTSGLSGVTIPELADNIIAHGVKNGWIHSGKNEYKHETRYQTGPHIHLDMNVEYFNDNALFQLR